MLVLVEIRALPVFFKAEYLEKVILKWEEHQLSPPTSNLWLLIQKCFVVSKIFGLKLILFCVHFKFRFCYYFCFSVHEKCNCIVIYCSLWPCFHFNDLNSEWCCSGFTPAYPISGHLFLSQSRLALPLSIDMGMWSGLAENSNFLLDLHGSAGTREITRKCKTHSRQSSATAWQTISPYLAKFWP